LCDGHHRQFLEIEVISAKLHFTTSILNSLKVTGAMVKEAHALTLGVALLLCLSTRRLYRRKKEKKGRGRDTTMSSEESEKMYKQENQIRVFCSRKAISLLLFLIPKMETGTKRGDTTSETSAQQTASLSLFAFNIATGTHT
jgi:hypothetical protein